MFHVYLDDNRPGPNNGYFESMIGWEHWVIVRSVENVKTLLTMNMVDDLSLDHDMGYNSESGSENLNGKQLVLWMIENNKWPRGTITIHSANIDRAIQMKELIDKHRPKD